MSAVVVLQARTDSSRLPGKALLPIGGLPMVVLAALRAGNRGRRVIVATSESSSDDALAAAVTRHGLELFRGSHGDVLGRFAKAVCGLGDGEKVIRLTADNVLPDGDLLDRLEREFETRALAYCSSNNAASELPYGLSAEIMSIRDLREADAAATNAYDREHVTPWIIRKRGMAVFEQLRDLRMGHYRCTVDTLDDYIAVERLFRMVEDPIGAGSITLVKRLKDMPERPIGPVAVPRMVLGTVQLGQPYGIANKVGPPPVKDACAIIRTAIRSGVKEIDTARAYGLSEQVIARALSGGWHSRAVVATKMPALPDPADLSPSPCIDAVVEASVFQSCRELQRSRIDVLMLHSAADRTAFGGAAWQRLKNLQKEGVIGTLGVSVYTPAELESALKDEAVEHVQLPYNILDWRWERALPAIHQARATRGVVVHARSLLLQGLLLSADEAHWTRAHVPEPAKIQSWLADQVKRFDRENIADLCIAYVNGQSWLDGCVIGVESMDQLRDNILFFGRAPLSPEAIAQVDEERPKLEPDTLNPAKWAPAA